MHSPQEVERNINEPDDELANTDWLFPLCIKILYTLRKGSIAEQLMCK